MRVFSAGRRLLLALLFAPAAVHAFDVNGVALGANEADIRKAMPSARCKPLEWESRAADRRCDDARIVFAGIPAGVTLYLKAGKIRAFDVRFDTVNRERVMSRLRSEWGVPVTERTESASRPGGNERRIFKARWARGGDQALLASPLDRKRALLSAWRGDFEEEIYRVR